jgi:hypothetical protein
MLLGVASTKNKGLYHTLPFQRFDTAPFLWLRFVRQTFKADGRAAAKSIYQSDYNTNLDNALDGF